MQRCLTQLDLDHSAIIKKIDLPNKVRERLHSLGIIEGLKIRFVNATPLNDPLIYQVINSYIAIHRNLAKNIDCHVVHKAYLGLRSRVHSSPACTTGRQ